MARGVLVPLTLSLLSAAPASALTWAEARAQAQRSAPELAVSWRRAEAAGAEVRVAGALANPTVTVTTARETARLSTGVSLPLPLFGQRGAAVQAARADARAVEREVQVTENELRWNVTNAWIDAWQATRRAQLLAGGATDAQRLLGIARERFQAGSSPRLDVVRATADEARTAADAQAARTLVAAESARLAIWVAGDPTHPPPITGDPGVSAGVPALEALIAAVTAHPALQRDEAQTQAAASRLALEKRLRLPTVSAELVVNQGDPTLTDGNGVRQTDVIAGAAFELPVLNQRGGTIARADAQRRLAQAATSLDRAHLIADLAVAFRRTEAAATRAREITRRALPAMEEARAMTEESYRAGRADLVRVLEAERAVLDLRLAQAEAIATWARSFADLEKATGAPLTTTSAGDALP